jgi:hypothetical protein
MVKPSKPEGMREKIRVALSPFAPSEMAGQAAS